MAAGEPTPGAAPIPRAAAVDGLRIEAIEHPGDAGRRALVLLHEGLGSVGLWRAFPDALHDATGRRVLAFSRFGHGRSDPPRAPRTPAFFHEEALEVLPALLGELDARDPILVGHSDGGSIALIHAGAGIRSVRGVVTMAAHVFVEDLSVASIEQARDTFATTDLRERMARYHRDPDATFRLWNDIWLAPEFRDWNIEDVLPRIDAPVLAIQGEHDQYGTLAQIDAIESGVAGEFERVVLDARHAPHLEARAATVRAAAEFILR